MKITQNINIYAGMDTQNTQKATDRENEDRKSLYAGSMNEDIFANTIAQKKKEAQEKAMKVITDAWEGDRKIDDDLQARRERISALNAENKEAQSKVKEINQMQEDLMTQYGVTEDSQEQKDLELLRKERAMFSGKGGLTQEELMHVAKLKKDGLTEYQQRQLELDSEKDVYQATIDENNKAILEENAIVRGTKLERLKHSPMAAAQKQADAILDAASKEIIGMVIEDAREHIDEEQEEREEKAEKLEEKREEQEELIEKQKERREEQEELLEDMPVEEMLQLSHIKTDVQQEVKNILSEMKLVAEDIKGAVVDESL